MLLNKYYYYIADLIWVRRAFHEESKALAWWNLLWGWGEWEKNCFCCLNSCDVKFIYILREVPRNLRQVFQFSIFHNFFSRDLWFKSNLSLPQMKSQTWLRIVQKYDETALFHVAWCYLSSCKVSTICELVMLLLSNISDGRAERFMKRNFNVVILHFSRSDTHCSCCFCWRWVTFTILCQ